MEVCTTVRKNPAITYPVITNPAEISPSEMNPALSESPQNWISSYLNLPKTESRLIWISPKLNPTYYEFRQKSNPPKLNPELKGFRGHLSFVGYGSHRGHWGQRAAEGKQISGGVYGRAISEAKYESFSILGLLHVSIQKKWYSFWWNSFLAGFFRYVRRNSVLAEPKSGGIHIKRDSFWVGFT